MLYPGAGRKPPTIKRLSALEEFQKLGGRVGFLSFLKKWFFEVEHWPEPIKESYKKQIVHTAEGLIGRLNLINISQKEPLRIYLNNLAYIFKKLDTDDILEIVKKKKRLITKRNKIEFGYIYCFPEIFYKKKLKYKNWEIHQKNSGGGASVEEKPYLLTLVPALVFYIEHITGNPNFNLVRKLITEEFNQGGCPYLKSWWDYRVKWRKVDAWKNLGAWRRRIFKYAMATYLVWSAGKSPSCISLNKSFKEKNQPRLKLKISRLNKEQKKYISLLSDHFPFLKKDIHAWYE